MDFCRSIDGSGSRRNFALPQKGNHCQAGALCIGAFVGAVKIVDGKSSARRTFGATLSSKKGRWQCRLCGRLRCGAECMLRTPHKCAEPSQSKLHTTHPLLQWLVPKAAAIKRLKELGFNQPHGNNQWPLLFDLPTKPEGMSSVEADDEIVFDQDFIILVEGQIAFMAFYGLLSDGDASELLSVVERMYWLGGKVVRSEDITPKWSHVVAYGMRASKGGVTVLGRYHNSVKHPRCAVPEHLRHLWKPEWGMEDKDEYSKLVQVATSLGWFCFRDRVGGLLREVELGVAKHPGPKAVFGGTYGTATVCTHNYECFTHMDKTDCPFSHTLYLEDGDMVRRGVASQLFRVPRVFAAVKIAHGMFTGWNPLYEHGTDVLRDVEGAPLHDVTLLKYGHGAVNYLPPEDVKTRLYAWTVMQKPAVLSGVDGLWQSLEDEASAKQLVQYRESRKRKAEERDTA
jgi:hypothetical protein